MNHGPRQALEEMQPLLERWDALPRGEPAVVTLNVLAHLDRWFVMFGMPKTATESYSPDGWRPVLGVWSSTSALFAELADNMGGGVPTELIRALILLAHDEWTGTPVDRS